jgi:hypothetical protein
MISDDLLYHSLSNLSLEQYYLSIYIITHIHTYIHSCMHAYIHTYTHTYIYYNFPVHAPFSDIPVNDITSHHTAISFTMNLPWTSQQCRVPGSWYPWRRRPWNSTMGRRCRCHLHLRPRHPGPRLGAGPNGRFISVYISCGHPMP